MLGLVSKARLSDGVALLQNQGGLADPRVRLAQLHTDPATTPAIAAAGQQNLVYNLFAEVAVFLVSQVALSSISERRLACAIAVNGAEFLLVGATLYFNGAESSHSAPTAARAYRSKCSCPIFSLQ